MFTVVCNQLYVLFNTYMLNHTNTHIYINIFDIYHIAEGNKGTTYTRKEQGVEAN